MFLNKPFIVSKFLIENNILQVNIYIKNEPTAAANSFSNYLEKFPDGSFATDAHYYRAECLIRNKQADVALPDYEYVSKKNGTKYTEKALLMVARISYDAKNYDKAITYYKETEQYFDSKENYKESLIGQMNCYFEQKNYSDALNYAEKVYANEKSGTDEQNHALLIKGKCQFFANNITEATGIFAELVKATKTESGAESKYYLALIQYNAKNYDEAKKIAFDLSRQIPSYDYWIAKGFIILADCYAAQGNTLQAKSTLQSIIDEYDGNDDVLPTAKEKLEKLFEIK